MSTIEGTLDIPPPAGITSARRRNRSRAQTRRLLEHDRDVGVELSRRLYLSRGAAPRAGCLGTFSVAWANTDLASKMRSSDSTTPSRLLSPARKRPAIRAQPRAVSGSRCLGSPSRLSSPPSASRPCKFLAIVFTFRGKWSALAFVLCALPGIALYRVCTSISRGMKVMKHDIYSRGMTEPPSRLWRF